MNKTMGEEAAKKTEATDVSRDWIRRLFHRFEIDQAVFFSLAQRVWQFLAGPITLLLMGRFFSTELQGYYYTFWSVIAMQVFFELALPQTIITTASYQWSKLTISADRRITGDPDALSRLGYLTRVSVVLFAAISIAFMLVIGVFGYWFFSQDASSQVVEWQLPWLSLIVLSALAFAMTPLTSILEGCNRVDDVYKLQFIRLFLGSFVVWIAIVCGFGLWIPSIATLTRLFCEFAFLGVYYRHFFHALFTNTGTSIINWRKEVWPFQSQVLLKGLLHYFHADLMGPVLFHYHGAAWAGQLGMTWQILSSLRTASSSWVRVRQASMGALVAGQKYKELDRIFKSAATIGMTVMTVGAGVYWICITLLSISNSSIAMRLLPPLPTALLIIGLLASLFIEFLWGYIHSHRVSPYLLFTWSGLILSGLLTWWWGWQYGRTGVAMAYCFIQAGLFLPMSIWAWHRVRLTLQSRNHA